MKDTKKITIKDLLNKKEELKKKKLSTQMMYIKSLDGSIKIQEPTREICTEAFEMARDDVARSDTHVVYNCVIEPNLKDKELQDALGCAEPTDIVDILFRPGDTAAISGHCMEMAGYGDGIKRIDDDIKN